MIVILEKGSILWRCQSPISSSMTNLSCTGLTVLVCCTFNELRGMFWLSDLVFPGLFRCSRGKHVRIPHAVSWYQIHHRLWFCCDFFFTCIFWRSFRHRFKTIDETEMADVEQTQKMIPFITCEISLVSPRSTTRPLYFWCFCLQFGVLQMTDVHQWRKMIFYALRPCFIDHLWFVSDFCYVPRRNLFQFLPFFIHWCFCCGYLHCLRHRNKFVYQIVMLQWLVTSSCNMVLMIFW